MGNDEETRSGSGLESGSPPPGGPALSAAEAARAALAAAKARKAALEAQRSSSADLDPGDLGAGDDLQPGDASSAADPGGARAASGAEADPDDVAASEAPGASSAPAERAAERDAPAPSDAPGPREAPDPGSAAGEGAAREAAAERSPGPTARRAPPAGRRPEPPAGRPAASGRVPVQRRGPPGPPTRRPDSGRRPAAAPHSAAAATPAGPLGGGGAAPTRGARPGSSSGRRPAVPSQAQAGPGPSGAHPRPSRPRSEPPRSEVKGPEPKPAPASERPGASASRSAPRAGKPASSEARSSGARAQRPAGAPARPSQRGGSTRRPASPGRAPAPGGRPTGPGAPRAPGVVQRRAAWPPPKRAPLKKRPTPGTAPQRPAAPASSASERLLAIGGGERKRIQTFADLAWRCPVGADPALGTEVVALDVGVEGVCTTAFEGAFDKVRDQAQPTMVLVEDSHAFRTLEPFSLQVGVPAWERWPSERVLRGTHGALLLPSQIGLVEFPADHVLSALIAKVRSERRKEHRDVVLTLPTFLPSSRSQAIRDQVASYRKGAFAGVPSAIAAAYFYLAPGLARVEGELGRWSQQALAAGRVLVLDWGASGLEYGLVTVREGGGEDGKTELRLSLAGTWPSLGGHRLTLEIVLAMRDLLIERLLESGPSDDLVQRALLEPGQRQQVPRPFGYDEAFRRLEALGEPSDEQEEREARRLEQLLFPTAWRFRPGEEPLGFAPYRRLAVLHFKALWQAAERLKRLILSDPARYRKRRTIPWHVERIDSPFVSDLDRGTIDFPVARFLDPLEQNLAACLGHIVRRLRLRGIEGALPVAVTGMQAGSSVLDAALAQAGDGRELEPAPAPHSSDPLELKSVVNRGAALLFRDKKGLDFGPIPEVLPFSIQIADCLGNITIFAPGPLDELAVFQRRIRVEEGFPQFEFFLYESEDGSQRGPFGCIEFQRPFDFTERDRQVAVDPRYGFKSGLPTLRELKGDDGAGLTKCFDRATQGWTDGTISFRSYAPRTDPARRLLHFLEHGLKAEFRRKVFLLEREFVKPPMRFDYVYQRYYLSRSQELLVVREWWAPAEGGKLMRHKTLHTCQGTTEANAILGLDWGTY